MTTQAFKFTSCDNCSDVFRIRQDEDHGGLCPTCDAKRESRNLAIRRAHRDGDFPALAWINFDEWFESDGHWMFGTGLEGIRKAETAWMSSGIVGITDYPGPRA